MRINVVGHTHLLDHPRGHGHWWHLETQYLHSLMHDPFILSRTGNTPMVSLGDESFGPAAPPSLVIYGRPTLASDEARVREAISAGHAVVLNRPEFARAPRRIESLRERWDLGSSRNYYYADQEQFDVFDPSDGKVLSWIGDHPDLIVRNDREAAFAGNPWATVFRYLNTAIYPRLLLDFADVLVRLVARMSKLELKPSEVELMVRQTEIRRDFHAFGFAVFTIEQLEKSLGVSRVDLAEGKAAAIQAARTLAAGGVAEAQSTLGRAFGLLEKENRKLQPEPAIFTDTLHGGGLFEDIGYCEFDWPQHPADVLNNHLDWAEQRGYRFNIDFAAKSLDQMNARFPKLFARLRGAQDRGLVEMVNGTWNQPYPPFFDLESFIRQFDLGQQAMREMFGRPARSFASQEYSFAPQVATILAQHGFEQNIMRVQNMGDAPTRGELLVRWTAPNGDDVLTLPSHAYKSEQRNEVTYNNVHLKLFAAAEAKIPSPHVFTGLGDITYYRPFREELGRIAHYAPVFGRFSTWSNFFAERRSVSAPTVRTTMEDYDCRAAFLEIEKWTHLRLSAGGYVDFCMRSNAASALFRAAEIIDALMAATPPCHSERGEGSRDLWQSLATFQGHDRHMARDFPSGAFMGGVNAPYLRVGRNVQTVSDYPGVWDSTTIDQRASRDLDAAEEKARAHIQSRLATLSTSTQASGDRSWVVFNPGPANVRVVRFEKAAGRALLLNGEALALQEDGDDQLALLSLPGYACSFVTAARETRSKAPTTVAPVRTGGNFIENDLLRVEFDRATGVITRVIKQPDGETLFASGNRFTAPGAGAQQCEEIRWRHNGPLLAAVELVVAFAMSDGPQARIRTLFSLSAGQTWLDIQQTVESCPKIEGDPWKAHLGAQFTFPSDGELVVRRSHFNVMEDSRDERIFSPLVLSVTRAGGTTAALLNRGNQFYVRRDREITSILIGENEPARTFEHRIGYSRSGNPARDARAWASPWFVQPLASNVNGDARGRVNISSDDVELLSVTRIDDQQVRLRLANLVGEETRAEITMPDNVTRAWHCDLSGQRTRDLVIREGRVDVTLRPWDIVQVIVARPSRP